MGELDNSFRECITEVVFVAFDRQDSHFFFDSTPLQCSNFIWDKICPTAVILYINEYSIEKYKAVHQFKRKLSDEELQKKINKL